MVWLFRLCWYLRAFDHFLLDRFYQKVADRVHQHFGISCFLLSNIAFIVSCCVTLGRMYLRGDLRVAGNLPFVCSVTLFYAVIYIQNQYFMTRMKDGFANPQRELGWVGRIFFMLLFLWAASWLALMGKLALYTVIDDLLWLSSLYFLACNPLPPQKSTVRKWVEKLLSANVVQPAPARSGA